MDIDSDRLIEILSREMRIAPNETPDGFRFEMRDGLRFDISTADIDDVVAKVSRLSSVDESSVAGEYEFEMLVRPADSRPGMPMRFLLGDLPITLSDTNQDLTFSLTRPSFAFCMLILDHETRQDLRPRTRIAMRSVRIRGDTEQPGGEEEPRSIVDTFREDLPFIVIRITSESKKRSSKVWRQLADSFLFHVAFNLDASLVPRDWKSPPSRPARVRRVGRQDSGDLDVPRRTYLTDLVHHYLLGASSPSPMLQYISYYHVAEHWFESIYQDDLVEDVQRRLTAPGFSLRRKRDVQDLIKKITKAVQVRNDDLVINEQVALRLTLQKYVDLATLTEELQTLSPGSVEHYASSKVSFSDGDLVSLDDSETDRVYAALGRRIYKTRNSIVHAKDGALGRFIPYTHDDALMPEIPLMRLITEQIIIATSSDHIP